MNDIPVKMRPPRALRLSFLLMVMLSFCCVSGCSTKSTVMYTPNDACNSRDGISQSRTDQDENEEIAEALKEYFTRWQGTRYRYGGLSHDGVDCSGLTLITYKELFGKNLPRTVREQVKKGKIIAKDSLQAGDLIFFKTGIFQKHVGIYLEDDLFIHASGSKGVTISSLNNEYWQKRYWQAQRL
ncbi:hypothetical protein FCL47_16240 [Desulfopila sp. IMCC35006]|uniref:C40 family peptidase n=1 Tax=Desulfopila sp. IMCC35006 TaxID=2569542 RepID=UPI0010ACE9E1|nr:NlpC/P60 family protein [Desulfopila sp. IMCC35006]TKB24792.1 hypothetical protein FCL47_16240 [Desulfopila sp. IMCC35006]